MKIITNQVSTALSKVKNALGKSSSDDMFIGEVLKQKHIITNEQLQTGLKVQKDKLIQLGQAMHLGLIIVELGFASEDEVVQAINEHYQLSATSLSDNIKDLIRKLRERLPSPRIPIWLQLSAITIFVIIVTILVLNYFILHRQKEQLYEQTVKIGMVSLNYFGSNARIPLIEDNVLNLNALIKNAAVVEGLVYAIIVGNDRLIKAHTDLNKISTPFKPFDSIKRETRKGDVTFFNYSLPNGSQILNLSRPVIFKNKTLGEVHVGVSIDFIQQVILKERQTIIRLTLLIICVGIIIAVLQGFHFSQPISKLVIATQEIANGNYQHKVEIKRNDELNNLATAFNRMSEELWKQSLMQKSFGKYIGSEVLEMIMADPETTWLKGHRNEATILFADIRGFTPYSDRKEPEAVVEQLNEFFEISTKVILQHDGYVDKFIGDGVLGIFGVPVYQKNHIERAVNAAVDLQKALRNANKNGNEFLKAIGIGIDSGIVVAGNIGSQVKMEYTVIGDSVNVASRLNGLAGPGEVIISKRVYEKIAGMIEVEELPPQKIKGKPEPIEIFKLLA